MKSVKTKTKVKPKRGKPKKPRAVKYVKEEYKDPKLFEFTASVKPYQILEEDKELERLRAEHKADEQNKVLLEKELEKPFNSRNQTLVKKYASRIDESYAWPDVFSKKYEVTAFAPDDGFVKIEDRPLPYYLNYEYKSGDSTITYKFPISKYLDNGGESFYKIDGTNTIVDSAGNISDFSSDEITPYVILKRFDIGDVDIAEPYKTVNGYFFDFPGFRIKSKVVNKEVVENKKVKSGLQEFTIDDVDSHWRLSKSDGKVPELRKKKVLAKVEKGFNLGTGVPEINKDQAILDGFVLSASTNSWCVYYHISTTAQPKSKKLHAAYIEGIEGVFDLISNLNPYYKRSNFKSVVDTNAIVSVWNREKVKEFRAI